MTIDVSPMSKLSKIQALVRLITTMLLQADYDGIARLTNDCRLTSTELAHAIREYPGTLVLPPENAFQQLDVIEIAQAQPRAWSVNLKLWTAEEGQSDLTLRLTVRDGGKENYDVEVEDLLVC